MGKCEVQPDDSTHMGQIPEKQRAVEKTGCDW